MNESKLVLLTADVIAPMTGPPFRDGGVLFSGGLINDIGLSKDLRRKHPHAVVHDYPGSVILPGLVNAHVHLELSDLQQGPRPTRFVDWLTDLMRQSIPPAVDVPTAIRHATERGIAQCLKFGVTSVGDISSQPALTRPVLAESGIVGVSYGEVRAMAQRRGFLDERLHAALHAPPPSARFVVGVTPHAPYSVEVTGYKRCLAAAIEAGAPLATHLAETSDEALFLAAHAGPFRDLWTMLNAWDEDVPKSSGGPIRTAEAVGLLAYPSLLAHVNYCDDTELDLLTRGRAGVVYCPRTHEFFGHRPHRWREMLARGINVAVGTDSCGSSPNLNLVDDLRLLHRLAPEISALSLWEMATTRAARAIGGDKVGRLAVGTYADATIFPEGGPDCLENILQGECVPSSTWLGGTSVRHG